MGTPGSEAWHCWRSRRPTAGPASNSVRTSCPTTWPSSWSTPRPIPPAGANCCWTTGPASSCCGWRLEDAPSPYADVLRAVTATLPALGGDEREAVHRLAVQGPPTEEVGLAPFGPPEQTPVSLPFPTTRQPDLTGHSPMSAAASATDVGTVDTLLWVVVPYVCLAVFAVGHFWRYRYDKFGWTTRSSQLYESRLLRLGSPLFHFGLLFVILGHVMGLGVPKSWTEAVGHLRGDVPRVGRRGRLGRRAVHPGRHGDPDLPAPHRRAGVLGHDPHGQGDVRRPGHRDRPRPRQHRRGQHVRPLRLPRRRLDLVPRHLPARPADRR